MAVQRPALPFGDMSDHVKQILVDAFGRVRELVIDLTDGLTDEIASYRPDPGGQFDCMADLASEPGPGRSPGRSGTGRASVGGVARQVWAALQHVGHRIRPRPEGCRGRSVERSPQRIPSGGSRALRYVDGITADELDRIVDTRWDPPVTAAVRLVSVIGDTMQHLGQAAYVRGLAERRDSAWHQPGAADR